MLEHVPEWLGRSLRGMRAGMEKVAASAIAPGEVARIDLASTAFADGGRLPDRFTADGAGVSPPLAWRRWTARMPAGSWPAPMVSAPGCWR